VSAEPLLVEVIGGPKVVLDLEVSGTVEELATAAAEAASRSLVDGDGKPKAWRLFAPNGKGGFTPARPDSSLANVADEMKKLRDSGGKGGFAGPGSFEGTEYLFRIRLFVPSLPPPRPVDEKPEMDEEAIDLTNMEDDVGLQTVRRIKKADPPKRKKRRRDGPRTGKMRTVDGRGGEGTVRHKTVGGETGRRRRRQSGEIPTGAGRSGRMRAPSTGDIPEGASESKRMRRRKRATATGDIPEGAGESKRMRRRKRATGEIPEGDRESGELRQKGNTGDIPPNAGDLLEGGPPGGEKPPADPSAETLPSGPDADIEGEEPAPNEVGESTARMSAEALDRIAIATGRRTAPEPGLWQGSHPAATAPTAAPDAPPPKTEPPPPRAEPPPKAAPPPEPEALPEKVEEARVVTQALAGKTPERGTPPVTSSGPSTQSRTGGRSGTLGRSTGTLRRTATLDGARKTGSGGGGKGKKTKGSSGIMGLLVALVLFAVVTVTFVVLLQDEEIDPNPTPDAQGAGGITRLSDRLEIEAWAHPTAVDLGELLGRFNGLVAGGTPRDVDRVSAIEVVADEFARSCDEEFLACAAGSRAAFAAYRGCRTISGCDADRTRARFKDAVELSERSLKAVTSLEPEFRTDALKRVTVQAVRLAGQSMTGLKGMAPDLATLAEQACTGSLKAMPDCIDALKP
jgi:hypothetical protein